MGLTGVPLPSSRQGSPAQGRLSESLIRCSNQKVRESQCMTLLIMIERNSSAYQYIPPPFSTESSGLRRNGALIVTHPEDVRSALDAGADIVLPKPLSRPHFLRLVDLAVARASSSVSAQ